MMNESKIPVLMVWIILSNLLFGGEICGQEKR